MRPVKVSEMNLGKGGLIPKKWQDLYMEGLVLKVEEGGEEVAAHQFEIWESTGFWDMVADNLSYVVVLALLSVELLGYDEYRSISTQRICQTVMDMMDDDHSEDATLREMIGLIRGKLDELLEERRLIEETIGDLVCPCCGCEEDHYHGFNGNWDSIGCDC